jgi:hypothetical protein
MSDDERIINTDELRRKADKVRESQTDTEVALLRRRTKCDLFFLSDTVLGFDRLRTKEGRPTALHGDFCTWMGKTNEDRFRLILMPRGFLKTTINTISDSIQIALPDDSGNQPFPRNLGTNVRILLAHEVQTTASENLQAITGKIFDEEFLVALFPELVPGKHLRVNQTNLELPRTKSWPESTFTVMGRGAAGQGKHFDMMKVNDIVGLNAMQSEADFTAAKTWVRDLKGMFTQMNATHVDFEGVRYRKDDIYSVIKEDFKTRLKIYTRSIYERDEKNQKYLIWPEATSWEDIEEMKANDLAMFNSQYMNNPMETEGEFSQEWERYFEFVDDRPFEITAVQLDGTFRRIDTRELDILILADPAMTGFSGIVVTGTDRWGVVYILQVVQEKLVPEAFISMIFGLVAKWNPRAFVCEKVLFSGLFENVFKREMRLRGTFFRVIMVTTKQKQKEDRIRVLRQWFANGKIWFHSSQKDSIVDQYRSFPYGSDIHSLDALAMGPEVWRTSIKDVEVNQRDEALDKFNRSRSIATGYSAIKYA